MRKLLIPAIIASALALGTPSAFAADAEYAGGCAFAALSDPTPDGNLGGQGAFTGEIDWQVVLFDSVDAGDNPISATVSCVLTVNGVPQDGTTPTSVTVAGAGADVATYTKADPSDVVELCTVITDWSDGSANVNDCGPATTQQIPPQEVLDIIDAVFQLVADTTEPLDSIICGALTTAGIPALLNSTTAITTVSADLDDCDLYLGGEQLIDFSPYGA